MPEGAVVATNFADTAADDILAVNRGARIQSVTFSAGFDRVYILEDAVVNGNMRASSGMQ